MILVFCLGKRNYVFIFWCIFCVVDCSCSFIIFLVIEGIRKGKCEGFGGNVGCFKFENWKLYNFFIVVIIKKSWY